MFRKLALVATTVASLFAFSSAFAADEVKLAFGSLSQSLHTNGCPSCYDMSGEIEVKNIAYVKEVWVWYNTGSGGWKTVQATYDTQIDNNKETWDFNLGLGFISPASVQIAIQYKVNGAVYWDNNSALNYNLGGTNAFNKLNTVNMFPKNNVEAANDKFRGDVVLKNIAFQKTVKIVYSLDNWATTNQTNAVFGALDGNLAESWSFSTDIPAFSFTNLPNIQYNIVYTVAGVTYTDNNHGRNYKVTSFSSSM